MKYLNLKIDWSPLHLVNITLRYIVSIFFPFYYFFYRIVGSNSDTSTTRELKEELAQRQLEIADLNTKVALLPLGICEISNTKKIIYFVNFLFNSSKRN